MELKISEILLIRSALNCLWDEYVKKHCPKKLSQDLNKYYQWCQIQEKDKCGHDDRKLWEIVKDYEKDYGDLEKENERLGKRK